MMVNIYYKCAIKTRTYTLKSFEVTTAIKKSV